MKNCNNCLLKLSCFYRGILNPCDMWKADSAIYRLRNMAKAITNKTMSFEEHRFVNSCTTLISFSTKQESWLRSIFNRLKDVG